MTVTVTDTPLAHVLHRLACVTQRGESYMARCPAHDDQVASLSVSTGRDGRVILNCHAGCETTDVIEALGLTFTDLFAGASPYRPPDPAPALTRAKLVKSYDYTDANGQLLFQTCRFEPKTFRQRRPNGNGEWHYNLDGVEPVLYNLPKVLEAVAMERGIYVVEGEKDADALTELGYTATTAPMGAGKWRESYSKALAGASVTILPDNDEPGRKHAEQVAASLASQGCVVKIVTLPNLPPKGDVSDWLARGGDLDELAELEANTPAWCPDPERRTRWRLDELVDYEPYMRPPPPVVPRVAWRGRSTLLAAGEKTGKSTLTGYLAAQVSRGGTFLDDPCDHGTVLIVGLEEFIGDAGRRLVHFRADPKRVHIVYRLPSDPTDRRSALVEHIRAVHPVLVIVDTLVAYGEGRITDASSSAQMHPIVNELTGIAHEEDVALILNHHGRKSDGKYRDSTAIGAAVDVILEVFVKDEDADPTLRKVHARGRVPVHSYAMRFDGHTYTLDMGAKAPLDQRIISEIRSRPGITVRDVLESVTGRSEEINRLILAMLADGRLYDQGGSRGRQLYVPAPLSATLRFGGPD